MRSNHGPQVQRAITIAVAEAEDQHSSVLGTPYLFIGLTKLNGTTAAALRAQGHDPKAVCHALRAALGRGEPAHDRELLLTRRAAASIRRAAVLAEEEGADRVEETHLLSAILGDDESSFTLRILRELGVELEGLSATLTSATPTVDRLGRDLTRLALQGKLDPVIGRKRELRQLARTLVRKKKNNPVLVGPAGVGKTAIVEGLAQRIASDRVPGELSGKRLVEVSTASIVSGTKYRGEFEERLLGLAEEVKKNEDVILFVDEIHTILRAGAVEGGSLDAGNILKPALARGEIRVIGATTTGEYRKYIAQDSALERRFQPVLVHEPTNTEAVAILEGLRQRYEVHHGVTITEGALVAAVELSSGWLPDRHLPDKALDLLDEACARVRIPTISKRERLAEPLIVTELAVAEVLANWIQVSASALLDAMRDAEM